jgi:hypothetical protein
MSCGYRQLGVQNLTSGAAAVNTTDYDHNCTVRIICAQATYIRVGGTAVATSANGTYVPANFPVEFLVGNGQRVSALQVTASGIVSVTEITK